MRSKRERDRDHDTRRRKAKPWRRWYSLQVWQQIRKRQLTEHPYCQRCEPRGQIVLATVCNHVVPHEGDWELFVGGPFESLCKTCHDADVQREERAARNGN
ncbi:MAG TPA: hypothetical protein VK973_05765 [Arenicellales bacterium]|nr:hypothetical protein [Arenicellales bacterium]